MKTTTLAMLAVQHAGRIGILALLLAGCSESPPRLFMLRGGGGVVASDRTAQAANQDKGLQQVAAAPVTTVGVSVTIPQYLDRPDIMVRTSTYELQPLKNARWAEGLSVTASRAVAGDLSALLPGDDVIGLPMRAERPFDYRIRIDLSTFETDASGNVELAGRWLIVDATEKERASGRFHHTATATASDAASIAATMSDMLSEVSAEISASLRQPRFASKR